jgi:phosphoglucosamine mutase
MARIFGTDGVRGLANIAPMSPEMVMALGRAAVHVLAPSSSEAKPSLIVGCDTRLSSPMFEAALTAGICSAGADVLNVGVLPTAGVAYLVRHTGAIGGVVISASHNPYMDNGIKFFSATGTKLEDRLEEELEARISRVDTGTPPTGEAIGCPSFYKDGAGHYIDFLKLTFHYETPMRLRIGLDCANGAASAVAPALFRQLGGKVRVWHAAPDGVNINKQCGAVYPAFLQQKVLEEKLDIGFAFDGDADRLIAIDHTGRILDGDYLLAVCAQAVLEEDLASQRIIVSTVMANLGLEQALRQIGFELYRTPVGDKYVVEGMQRTGARLGGEQSGHIVFLNHHTTGDGLLTAVQLLNVIAARQLPLATLAQILHKFPQILLNIKIRERRNPLDFPQVRQVVEEAEHSLGHEGRVVVRLSGTESVARVMVEGPEENLIESLARRIGQVITRALDGSAYDESPTLAKE